MKLKKQLILPVVAAALLATVVAPIAIVSTKKQNTQTNEVSKVNRDLFEIKDGVLKGFKSTVTKAQIEEYTKDGVLRLPSCKKIGSYAFNGVDVPFGDKIEISKDTQEVGSYAFYHCDSVTEVTFTGATSAPSQLQTIEQYAFANCTSLQSFPFPKAMLGGLIGEAAFMNCSSLRTLDFQSDAGYDGKFTSSDLSGMESIEISTGAFTGVFPLGGPEDPMIIKIGEIADDLPSKDTYACRFMLSNFASKIQMHTSIATTYDEWIKGETVDAQGSHSFGILSVLPEDWMEFAGDQEEQLIGINEEYLPLISLMPFNAISIPAKVEEINVTFWKSLPEMIREDIVDLDLSKTINMKRIPEEFLWDPENSEPYITPKNICLNENVQQIDKKAFYAGNPEMPSRLEWVNLNQLTNLQTIGEEAFDGNELLSNFGVNPINQELTIDESLTLDFGRENNLIIGDAAFQNTGIKNVQFLFTDKKEGSKAKITFGDNVFAGLKNLISISFDEGFVYEANYQSEDGKIQFSGAELNSEPVTQALSNLLGDDDHIKNTFANSFQYVSDDPTHPNYINIPQWPEIPQPSTETDIQEIYPDVDYYKSGIVYQTISRKPLTGGYWDVNGDDSEGTNGIYLQDMIAMSNDVPELLNFANWTIYSRTNPKPTEFTFEYSEVESEFIDSVTCIPEKPKRGQPFEIQIKFKESVTNTTLDRSATQISINGTDFTNYTLLTSDAGDSISIDIPASAIKGNVVATFTCKTRTAITTQDDTDDDQISGVSFASHLFEGEDVEATFTVEDGYDVDTDLSVVKSGEDKIEYGPNGYEIIKTTNSTSLKLLVHGWNVKAGQTISVALVSKEQEKLTAELSYDTTAFENPLTAPEVAIGEPVEIPMDIQILTEEYSYNVESTCALCMDSNSEVIKILYFTKTTDSMLSTENIPDGTSTVKIMLGTTNQKLPCTITPVGDGWEKYPCGPAFVAINEKIQLPIENNKLKNGYHYDVNECMAICTLSSAVTKHLSFNTSEDGSCLISNESIPADSTKISVAIASIDHETVEVIKEWNPADFEKDPFFPTDVMIGRPIEWDLESSGKLTANRAFDLSETKAICYNADGQTIQTLYFTGLLNNLKTANVPEGTKKVKISLVTMEKSEISKDNITTEATGEGFVEGAEPVISEILHTGDFINQQLDTTILQENYGFDIANCHATCTTTTNDKITLDFQENTEQTGYMISKSQIPAGTTAIQVTFAAKAVIKTKWTYDEAAFMVPPEEKKYSVGDFVSLSLDIQNLNSDYVYDLDNTYIQCDLEGTEPQRIDFDLVIDDDDVASLVSHSAIPANTTGIKIFYGTTNEDINLSINSSIEAESQKYIEPSEVPSKTKKFNTFSLTYKLGDKFKETHTIDIVNTMVTINGETKSIKEWQLEHPKLNVDKKNEFCYISFPASMAIYDLTIVVAVTTI